jgi:hypothetical protein
VTDVFQPSFWDDAEGDLWDEVDDLVILMQMAGVEAGASALPGGMQVLVNWDWVNTAVLDYASRYRYSLIKGIMDTTRQQVQKAISDWMREGSPLSALESRLEPLFGEIRAQRIAATEVTRFMHKGTARRGSLPAL